MFDPFSYRRALARLELRARGVSRRAPLATEPCRVPRAPPLLRCLPRERRSARRVARGEAIEARDGGGADRGDAVAAQPISARAWRSASTQSTWLRAVICNSRMVQGRDPPALCGPGIEAARHLQPRGRRHLPSGAPRGARDGRSSAPRHRCRVRRSFCSPPRISRAPTLGTAVDAFAQLDPPAHLIVGGRRQAAAARYLARARALRRRRSRHVRRLATSTDDPITARPTCSCCPRSTIPRPTSRSKPWRAHCP